MQCNIILFIQLVEEQCSKRGFTLDCFECINFVDNDGQVTVDFDPDKVAGWKRDLDGFTRGNKVQYIHYLEFLMMLELLDFSKES